MGKRVIEEVCCGHSTEHNYKKASLGAGVYPGARPDQVALDSPSHYVGTGILCPVRSVVDALRSYPDRHAGRQDSAGSLRGRLDLESPPRHRYHGAGYAQPADPRSSNRRID